MGRESEVQLQHDREDGIEPLLMDDERWAVVSEQANALANTHPTVYQMVVVPLLAEVAHHRQPRRDAPE